MPRRHLIEHHAEREQIAAPIHPIAESLFRRHVVRRSEHRTGAGLARVRDPRDAEVRDLHDPGLRVIHDVPGLDVAVNDVLLMGVIERISTPGHQIEHRFERQELARLRIPVKIRTL